MLTEEGDKPSWARERHHVHLLHQAKGAAGRARWQCVVQVRLLHGGQKQKQIGWGGGNVASISHLTGLWKSLIYLQSKILN